MFFHAFYITSKSLYKSNCPQIICTTKKQIICYIEKALIYQGFPQYCLWKHREIESLISMLPEIDSVSDYNRSGLKMLM